MRYRELSEWKARCLAYLNLLRECLPHGRLAELPLQAPRNLREYGTFSEMRRGSRAANQPISAEQVIRALEKRYHLLAKWAEEEHHASGSSVEDMQDPTEAEVNQVTLLTAELRGGGPFRTKLQREAEAVDPKPVKASVVPGSVVDLLNRILAHLPTTIPKLAKMLRISRTLLYVFRDSGGKLVKGKLSEDKAREIED